MNKNKKKTVIIIGGGASGLAAAIFAARQDADVTVLEHNDRVGKKILATGNGKCNITNKKMGAEYYRSDNPKFVLQVLERFSLEKTLEFFSEIGVLFLDKSGYLYPASGQAVSVSKLLELECRQLGVNLVTAVHVRTIKKEGGEFLVKTEPVILKPAKGAKNGNAPKQKCRLQAVSSQLPRQWKADRVILAAGSKAAPKQGSDGSGYELARSMGHRIITPLPALVQIRSEGSFLKKWAGIRTEAEVTLFVGRKKATSDRGEVQLTDYGISGIPVFQVSRFASKALEAGQPVTAQLDFFPDMEEEELKALFEMRFASMEYKTMEEGMIGMLHEKLAEVLLKEAGIMPNSYFKKLKPVQKTHLIRCLKNFRLPITAVNSFEQAQTCAGGVDTREIDPYTMESKIVKGLYLTGELMDVDGMCGGYNLQWAWSTGAIAGMQQ